MFAWPRAVLRPGARRWWGLALALAAVAAVVPAAFLAGARSESQSLRVFAEPAGQVQVVSFTVDGRLRSYRLYVPARLSDRPHTLLVAMHQLNGTAARFEARTGLDRGAATNDAVIAYPDGLGRSWNAGSCCKYAVAHRVDDVRFILRVVADVERRLPIDPSRVAVTGFSNGALMSYRLVCERPDVFRAAVAVAGDIVAPRCLPRSNVSLLHVHGARDVTIPIAGVRRSSLDAFGFPAAAASAARIAAADGCTGATTMNDATTTRWVAQGCPQGERVELVASRTLTHRYPTGPAAQATYGVDMSTLTWSFLRSAWPS